MGISHQEALDLLASDDLIGIGMAANEVRRRKNDPRIVTYQIDRNINYTNLCTEYCSFCAFYRPMGHREGYILPMEEIFAKIEEMIELGGTGVLLQGGLNPELPLSYYENLLRSIKARFPQVHLHCFSAPEILCIAEISGLSIRDTLLRLRDAGLASIPGGGAEILDDDVRAKISPRKIGWRQWAEVMREAHRQGLRTSATMMFGSVESPESIARHLLRVRELQDETGGFASFIPWLFQSGNTALSADPGYGETSAAGMGHAVGYLKVLAASRLLLPNIPTVQVSWVTMGAKVAQLGLFFGANDFGSTMIEENVVASAGVAFRMSEEEIVATIRDAGFRPVKREGLPCST
jgi:cyclic dehypoxanthinyl futalosine synthase